MPRVSIKLGQVVDYGLSQVAFGLRIRVILYDSNFYGLKLAQQCMQSSLSSSLPASSPSLVSFLSCLCYCPFMCTHQMEEQFKDHPSGTCPEVPRFLATRSCSCFQAFNSSIKVNMVPTAPQRAREGKCRYMCDLYPSDQCQLTQESYQLMENGGYREGKAPVWLYNCGDTPIACTINKQKREC